MENKPFVFGVATSGDNFTERKKETEHLLLNFRHGVNTVLISPRRWGKTSLVQKACRLAQSDQLRIVYLDIFLMPQRLGFLRCLCFRHSQTDLLQAGRMAGKCQTVPFSHNSQNLDRNRSDDGLFHIARNEPQEQRY